MDYQLKTRTKHENYHALNLTKEEYDVLQDIFVKVIQHDHPFTAFSDESRESKPTHLILSNYYYNVDFVIAEDVHITPV
jgi:hypothetical protein